MHDFAYTILFEPVGDFFSPKLLGYIIWSPGHYFQTNRVVWARGLFAGFLSENFPRSAGYIPWALQREKSIFPLFPG